MVIGSFCGPRSGNVWAVMVGQGSSTTSGTSHDISLPFGTPHPTRRLVTMFQGQSNSAISSVGIGASPFTSLVEMGDGTTIPIAAYYRDQPTGTSGTVSYTFSTSQASCVAVMYAVYGGYNGYTLVDSNVERNEDPITDTLTTEVGSVLLGFCSCAAGLAEATFVLTAPSSDKGAQDFLIASSPTKSRLAYHINPQGVSETTTVDLSNANNTKQKVDIVLKAA
jgi:hypothetical protein